MKLAWACFCAAPSSGGSGTGCNERSVMMVERGEWKVDGRCGRK